MSFFRRLLGRRSDSAGDDSRLRRASHVTPSREQPPAPIVDETPSDDEQPQPVEAADEASLDEAAPTEEVPAQETTPAPRTAEGALEVAEPAPAPVKHAPPLPQPQPAKPRRIPMPKPVLQRQPSALVYGIASHVGMVRENNEDASFGMQWHSITVDERPDFGFFIVADGMGGHLDGERAAGIAVQTLASDMLQRVYTPLLRDFHASESPAILDALIAAAESANRAVVEHVPGGGTTLTAAAVVGNLAYLAHVGDSRAYLIQGGLIEQLTTDHTLVQRLVQMKELTPEEAQHYPQKNVLYRAIGQNEDLKIERMIRALPPGARLVICTDGLWDAVDDEEIRHAVSLAQSPQAACDELVRLANARGGGDNITVIVVNLPDHSEAT